MTLRFHLTPNRMAKIKTSGDNTCWRGCGERGTLLHCWWDCKPVQPLQKSMWSFLRKLEINRSDAPAIPSLGIYQKDAPTCHRGMCSTILIVALSEMARSWKQPICPMTKGNSTNIKCGGFPLWGWWREEFSRQEGWGKRCQADKISKYHSGLIQKFCHLKTFWDLGNQLKEKYDYLFWDKYQICIFYLAYAYKHFLLSYILGCCNSLYQKYKGDGNLLQEKER